MHASDHRVYPPHPTYQACVFQRTDESPVSAADKDDETLFTGHHKALLIRVEIDNETAGTLYAQACISSFLEAGEMGDLATERKVP